MFSVQELRSSTGKELLLELEKAKNELLKIRINLKTKHKKDTSKAKVAKRYVAQILTVSKEAGKELKESEKAEKAEKVEKPKKAEKTEKVEKIEKSEKPKESKKTEKPEKSEKK